MWLFFFKIVVCTTILFIFASQMKLADEIKSNKFVSEHQKAHINVLFTANWLNGLMNKLFKKHDISSEQYNVLRILRGSHPIKRCLREITERMLDKNSNTSRIVKKLELKKLIEIEEHESDKRFYQIGISNTGLKLLKQIDLEMKKNTPVKQILTDKESKQLNELLDKMRD